MFGISLVFVSYSYCRSRTQFSDDMTENVQSCVRTQKDIHKNVSHVDQSNFNGDMERKCKLVANSDAQILIQAVLCYRAGMSY